MGHKSLSTSIDEKLIKEDRKKAPRVGRYHIGELAFYMPAFFGDDYIPFSSIKRIWSQSSQLAVSCCCGKGLPVMLICLQYINNEQKLELYKVYLEDQQEVDRAMELFIKGCPQAELGAPNFREV